MTRSPGDIKDIMNRKTRKMVDNTKTLGLCLRTIYHGGRRLITKSRKRRKNMNLFLVIWSVA